MIFFTVGITKDTNNAQRQSAIALADAFKQDKNHAQHIVCLNSPRFKRILQSPRRFVYKLNQHIESKGLDKSSFTDIYLVGSNIGLRQRGRNSQAQQIADALYKSGYTNIRVHAFSNQQPANEVKVAATTDHVAVTSKAKNRSQSTPFYEANIKKALDWDENTFWPAATHHNVDVNKSHAIKLINQLIVAIEKKHKPDSFAQSQILETLLNDIKSNQVNWDLARVKINSVIRNVTDRITRAALVKMVTSPQLNLDDSINNPIFQIYNQIDKHIELLRKEQEKNKFKLFSGHIGSYKLKVFTELRDIITHLHDIDEIRDEIRSTYKSNPLLAFGKNNSCRSTQLIKNILQGHPELGATGTGKLSDDDLQPSFLKHEETERLYSVIEL